MPRSTSLIDLDALPPDVARRVQWELDSAMRTYDRDRERAELLENASDAELIAAAQNEYPREAIGLSTWYRDVHPFQETVFNRQALWQKRRPVFLRGSPSSLVRIYCRSLNGSSANGWAIAVYWRALRMSRLTFMDHQEFEEWDRAISRKLQDRYRLTNTFNANTGITYREWQGYGDEVTRVIGGKITYLTRETLAHISALHAVIRKTDRLDEKARRAAAREIMMERLAA